MQAYKEIQTWILMQIMELLPVRRSGLNIDYRVNISPYLYTIKETYFHGYQLQ